MDCLALLLTAQMLFADASEHNEAGRSISEYMEVQRASWYMKKYRQCIKEEPMPKAIIKQLRETKLTKEQTELINQLEQAINKKEVKQLASLKEIKQAIDNAQQECTQRRALKVVSEVVNICSHRLGVSIE